MQLTTGFYSVGTALYFLRKDDAMAKAVSPSDDLITKGQAGKFVDLLVSALFKSGLPSKETQLVLETQGAKLTGQFIALVQAQVYLVSKFVHRTVSVNRTLSPKAAIAATGRNQYLTDSVVASMPQGKGDTVDITFIPLKKWMDDKSIDKLLMEHGLVAVDPFALAACNAVEPDFTDKHLCFTHWQDTKGEWCYAAFDGSSDERRVRVHRYDSGWDRRWWVAGVRVRKLS